MPRSCTAALAKLFEDRGVELLRTYQLNFGGNMDFMNMLERTRLVSKKISKTQSVTSQIPHEMAKSDVHIGPSDHVPWLDDRKWAYIRLEGRAFGDVPLNAELKLEVWDSPNSAGVIIDAVRAAKIALDRKIAGPILSASSLLHEVAAGAVRRPRRARRPSRTSSTARSSADPTHRTRSTKPAGRRDRRAFFVQPGQRSTREGVLDRDPGLQLEQEPLAVAARRRSRRACRPRRSPGGRARSIGTGLRLQAVPTACAAARLADRPGDRAVGQHLPVRDRGDRRPHRPLELAAPAERHRQVEVGPLAGEVVAQLLQRLRQHGPARAPARPGSARHRAPPRTRPHKRPPDPRPHRARRSA